MSERIPVKYQIVRDTSIEALESYINWNILNGWAVNGGISQETIFPFRYIQAMTKKEDDADDAVE